ncbi:MAG: family 78 glycoside hydrolase catalytic domain [Erysipelotrichaceae bacterium]|nr:family 78 glycoside hydrolase catalytic domain [Erysipelotrichaceae bacterium]
MKASRLKTEYLINPIGVDFTSPRFFWNCEDGKKQTAYHILVKNESNDAVWDSGKVVSNKMFADYEGEQIEYKQRYTWYVELYDENDKIGEQNSAYFETGLKPNEKWPAKWICGNYKVNKNKRYPVDYFKKEFETSNIKKARLYITACGLYCSYINNNKVGDAILSPGITDYRKRIQYQTYDVTNLLHDGANVLSVELADGWYRGSCGAWGIRNQYGTETKFISVLEITKEDNTSQTIVSDNSWSWSNDGELRFADNKDGEIIDANLKPSFTNNAKVTNHNVIPSCSNNNVIKEHEHFIPELIITPSNKKVLDFKQNYAGYISFKINAKFGQKINMLFGEMLDDNGEFTQSNIQLVSKKKTTPLQKIEYICKDGMNEYKTKFAIFGYRYVLVETDVAFKPEDFVGIALYTDMEATSSFESSNELLNQFVKNTIWSTKSNSADLPTDCPTRERHGWTGDAQIFADTFSYLFDSMSFEKKYLNDIYDWQKDNGKLPHIAPEGGSDFYMYGMNGSVGWADAGIIIPYVLWKKYNDNRILKQYIKGMERYIDFMESRAGKFYITAEYTHLHGQDRKYLINCGQSYGEWAEPSDVHIMKWTDCAIPHPESSTAYTVYMLDLMNEIETELGNNNKAKSYKDFADKCRNSYQALINKNKKYTIDTDRQASLVRPLAFNLLTEEEKQFARNRLIKALDNYGWRIGTGFLSTPLILYVLSDISTEYAYKLLENTKCPGWLNMAKDNSTTIWEAWEGKDTVNGGIASLNHYSKGAVCGWLFNKMCGINVKTNNHFEIKPLPGGNFKYAQATYDSVYGRVTSRWEKINNEYEYEITIPCNCTAEIILPSGKKYIQESTKEVYKD